MPVSKSKVGKPLGGIGAERQSDRRHSLILDDRLLSKQYISGRLDARIDDTAYGVGWDGVTDRAPSVNAVYDKINSLGTISDIWGQEDAAQSNTDVRFKRTGNFGIGDGTNLAFDDITEKLYVDGNIKVTGNLFNGGNLTVGSGTSATDYTITFDGESNDGVLTWMEDEDYFKFSDDILMNSTERLNFGDAGTYIYQSVDGQLDLVADTEIQIAATTIDMNGAADISGNLTVGGNLTVEGTATALSTETISMYDNIIMLNSNATGTASVDAGLEIERGDDANTRLVWDESADKWSIQPTIAAETYYPIISTGDTGTVTNTMLAGSIANSKLTNDSVTIGDSEIALGGTDTTITGIVSITGANSGDRVLHITGGNSAATNAAVTIVGHLEATTKSFNIPHPLLDKKRLIHGSLEGPEHGMYTRGSFEIEDERRIVAVDMPNYWPVMVYDDYTINLTAYGNYNVWISNRDETGFWVETNAEKEWSFDWNVIAGRKDAKMVVEPDA
tara:strand:- start:239 stop:1747 length:1509 start_codon:yes stop_codon:yes gene_type:complete